MSRKQWLNEGYFYYDKIRPFYCKHCNQRFEDWVNFYKHFKYTKQKIENEIIKSIDPPLSESYRQNKLKEKLKENKEYQLLQESYNENRKKRPFVCYICGKSFRNKKLGLKEHLKRVHGIDIDNQAPMENKTNEGVTKNDNSSDI